MNMKRLSRYARWSLWAGVPILLVGCGSIEPAPVVDQRQAPVGDDYWTLVLEAGKGGSCAMAPCGLYFKTPEGGGDIRIVINNIDQGTFPPGELVSLGNYDVPTVRIQLPGTDYPQAFVHIPARNG